jgi:hypothetical protein
MHHQELNLAYLHLRRLFFGQCLHSCTALPSSSLRHQEPRIPALRQSYSQICYSRGEQKGKENEKEKEKASTYVSSALLLPNANATVLPQLLTQSTLCACCVSRARISRLAYRQNPVARWYVSCHSCSWFLISSAIAVENLCRIAVWVFLPLLGEPKTEEEMPAADLNGSVGELKGIPS